MATIQIYIGENLIATYQNTYAGSVSRVFDYSKFFKGDKLVFQDEHNHSHAIHLSSMTTVIIDE